jgi:DNA helicase-2/ATP-dependent DNA helicase PcrA
MATGDEEQPKGRIQSLMEDVIRTSGLEAYYQKLDPNRENEIPNINELISSAAQFDEENAGEGSLDDYLGQVSLVSDVDALKDGGGAVTLMTLHAAKGLEFPVVAMIAMEEGALPHARVREHPEQLEEERRLCYVGITRAQRQLILSQAQWRQIRGQRDRTAASRFLGEMPPNLLEVIDHTGAEGFGDDDERAAERFLERQESSRLAGQFRKGQMVRHPQFGVGKIADISDMGQHTRAVIEFQRAGKKTLILQYARLEPVR